MSKPKILIVEGEAVVADDVGQRLLSMGYEVVVAGDGVVLPGAIDGIAAAEHFLRQEISVVYMTGYADPEVFHRAKQNEPPAFLAKPFHGGDLHRPFNSRCSNASANSSGSLSASNRHSSYAILKSDSL